MHDSAASAAAPIYHLPEDALLHIFSSLPIRQFLICRSLSKFFYQLLDSPSFTHQIASTPPPLRLIALRPPHHHHHHHHHRHHIHSHVSRHTSPQLSLVNAFDPCEERWLRLSLGFLPFRSLHPVASSSHGVVYLWGDSVDSPEPTRSLIACNPLTRQFKVLPQLGSAWSRHGSVLVDAANRVMVLTELAALYFTGSNQWLKFSSDLPSKPRSPVLVSDSAYTLCDIGSPWRSQWKLFSCYLNSSTSSTHNWVRLNKPEWGDVFDLLKRPRLVRGVGNQILMVGGLKSSFSLSASCSTIVILRLDLGTMEWDEAGRMPAEMFRCFSEESSKFKVFGGGNRVCFSGKRAGRFVMWDCSDGMVEWRWVEGLPGYIDGFCRGFVFEATLAALP